MQQQEQFTVVAASSSSSSSITLQTSNPAQKNYRYSDWSGHNLKITRPGIVPGQVLLKKECRLPSISSSSHQTSSVYTYFSLISAVRTLCAHLTGHASRAARPRETFCGDREREQAVSSETTKKSLTGRANEYSTVHTREGEGGGAL